MKRRTCSQCLLDTCMPGVALGPGGVCEACARWQRDPSMAGVAQAKREAFERDLEATLAQKSPHSEFDCIVSFSGGKDSCYLLHRLVKDYGLRVLAYTNDFDIPTTTWDNIRRTIGTLKVAHHVEAPSLSFYRRFIRYLLQNQTSRGAVHTICYFWLDLREGDILRLAMTKHIPLIITGYSPGQPEPERMLYEMPQERIQRPWVPRELFDLGIFDESEKTMFWDPSRYGEHATLPRIIAPFHAWEYDQADVTRRVCELGLVKNRWYANPVVSNFTLNWLFMYSDLKNLGYNPYKPEFSQLIREGRANRQAWRALFAAIDAMAQSGVLFGRHVQTSLQWLQLEPEQLRISEKSGINFKVAHKSEQPTSLHSIRV